MAFALFRLLFGPIHISHQFIDLFQSATFNSLLTRVGATDLLMCSTAFDACSASCHCPGGPGPHRCQMGRAALSRFFEVQKSASIVGFPQDSKISMQWILRLDMVDFWPPDHHTGMKQKAQQIPRRVLRGAGICACPKSPCCSSRWDLYKGMIGNMPS